MIHGWGYDINGKPIPNSEEGVDSPQFKSTYDGLSDKFSQNWLQDPDTWPVAPVDLRFDRKRGVWTVPSAFRLYQITLNEDISEAGGEGDATVIKYKTDILDSAGDAINTPTITVENWSDSLLAAGTKTLAYYDTAECKYWIVGAGGGGGDTTVKVGSVGCSNDISCSLLGSDCLLFGEGLHASRTSNGNFVVVGPKLSQDSECHEMPIPIGGFEELKIGKGLELEKTNSNKCIYELSGPRIKGTPSSSSPRNIATPCNPFSCLTFGDGLKLDYFGDCNYTVTADSYDWIVKANDGDPVTVVNGEAVSFVGSPPINTTVADDDPNTVTLTLDMADDPHPYDASTDIPISWCIVDSKLRLFIDSAHLKDCGDL